MSRIKEVFANKQKEILNVYFTAGYPKLNSTLEIIKALEASGADLIEIGMPYSDPLADGEVIQQSSGSALQNGMSIRLLLEQLAELGTTKTPLILMGYMNPLLQFGFEKFCAFAAEVGVDGLIIPDLPMYEYEREYGAIMKRFGLDFIFLITPETPAERIKKIDSLCNGFIYAVSSSATTGHTNNINDQEEYFKRLQNMKLNNPVLVGFGIKDKETYQAACRYTSGAIVGTAYIRVLGNGGDINKTTAEFIRQLR